MPKHTLSFNFTVEYQNEDIDVNVQCSYTPFVPGKYFTSYLGDWGYPDEPAEVDNIEVFDMDGKNITSKLSDDEIYKIQLEGLSLGASGRLDDAYM